MKKLKKLILGVVSIATAFSMFAFTACSGSSDDGVSSNDPTTEESGTGGETTGGESTGNESTGGESTGGEEVTEGTIFTRAIAATQNADYKSMSVYTNIEYSESVYGVDTGEDYEFGERDVISFLYDFDSSDYDVYQATYYWDNDYSVSNSYSLYSLIYKFMRGGYTFSHYDYPSYDVTASLPEIDADTGLIAYYNPNGSKEMASDVGQAADIYKIMPFAIAFLAEKYDAATITSDTITVDVGELANKLYSALSAVIEVIDSNTILSQLLENPIVKDLIDSISIGMDATAIYEFVIDMWEKYGGDTEEFKAVVPAPNEGDTLYEYLCALADDDEFYSAITGIIWPALTFGRTTLDRFLLEFFGISVEDLKAYFNMIDFSYTGGVATIGITDNSGEFVFDFLSCSVGGDLTISLNSDLAFNSIGFNGIIGYRTASDSESITAEIYFDTTITLSTSAAVLTDISQNPVSFSYLGVFDSVSDYIAAAKAA